jgi:hypothetical protein
MKDLSYQFPPLHGNGYRMSLVTEWALNRFENSPVIIIRSPYSFTLDTVECLSHKFTSHAIIARYVVGIGFTMGGFVEAVGIART